ncbi:MAG TPA: hypothetical protein VID94_04580 [Acidimicrobiales bacterium]
MGPVILLALAAGLVALGISARRNEQRRRASAAATVDLQVDRDTVSRTLADGRHEEVRWDELVEVEVLTTAIGVHKDDGVVFVLSGDGERGCLVPSRLAVQHGVIERLHALPGFDGRRMVAAMERPPPSRTTCWARDEQ